MVHAAEAVLATAVWPVVAVLGAHAERIRPLLAPLPLLPVQNENWPQSMGTSLRAGMDMLDKFPRPLSAVLITLCDQPRLSAHTINSLLSAWHQRSPDQTIAAAHYADRAAVPAIFGREHFAALRALTGEEGARNILAAHKAQTAQVPMPELAIDVDTPADWARLQHTHP